MKTKKGIYTLTVVTMLILSVIFLNSFHWSYKAISKRKILVGAIVFFLIVIVPILSVKIEVLYRLIKQGILGVENLAKRMKEKKKKIANFVGKAVIIIFLAGLATYLVSRFVLRTEFNLYLFYTLLAIALIGLFSTFLWKNAAGSPEKIFVVIAVTLGIFCIGVTPNRVGISWDDEIHYARTLEISNFLNGIMYKADEKNIAEYADNIYAHSGFDRETSSTYTEDLETLYASKEWSEHGFVNYGVWSVAYIPSAIGIMLARGLGLSYAGVFNMGRAFNLFMYVWLIYMSIKRVKYGKVLIAAIGLIPTTIFMASSYSYDPWVTGFTILGFSYFVAELQDDAPMENKNILIMIGAILLGCMPKATYFPLLFPLLFLPAKKFKTLKQRKTYYLSIIGAGVFLVATFMLPMLIKGPGVGDYRGGADVNSTEQIKFILQNPLLFAKILFNFELRYISSANMEPMLQRFAYVGEGWFCGIVSYLLVALTFLDRGKSEKNYVIVKGTGLIGCVVAIILSTMALYISFTAVGADTVAGMQGRYVIPTIYPALCAIGLGGVSHKINKSAFACVPMLLIAVTFIYNMYKLCVIPY